MACLNVGFAQFAALVGSVGTPAAMDYVAVGTDTTAVTAADTTLGAEITDSGLARAQVTPTRVTTTVTNDTLQLDKTFSVTGTKTVGEAGVLDAASSGNMAARSVLSPTRSVVSGDSLQVIYQIVYA